MYPFKEGDAYNKRDRTIAKKHSATRPVANFASLADYVNIAVGYIYVLYSQHVL